MTVSPEQVAEWRRAYASGATFAEIAADAAPSLTRGAPDPGAAPTSPSRTLSTPSLSTGRSGLLPRPWAFHGPCSGPGCMRPGSDPSRTGGGSSATHVGSLAPGHGYRVRPPRSTRSPIRQRGRQAVPRLEPGDAHPRGVGKAGPDRRDGRAADIRARDHEGRRRVVRVRRYRDRRLMAKKWWFLTAI